ncbi:MAG: magnesium and cobalt transport protein CorA [Novosphingobium sp.]|nr:magnesium and cobalt transport protein CorA [Novosphingobium sp.]
MTIVAAHRYASGSPAERDIPIDGDPRTPLPEHCFDWVGLCDPTPQEMELLRTQFELHPLAVEDALNPAQLPKVEPYGKQLFIVARTAASGEGDKIAYGQTALFLGHDFVISVRSGSSRGHAALRARLESDDQHLAEGPDYVVHAILDYIVDGYQPLMDKLEGLVQAMEERAIDSFPEPSTIRRLFRVRRQLRRFQRIIGPMEEVCERLATHALPAIDPSAHIWFRDVLDHVRRTMTRVNGLKETLASIFETAALLEQHRQGEITRRLAAWAAILAVPTAIAGIYGMNFQYMPELHWRYGYFAIWALIVLVCVSLYVAFRRARWL